jgi:hypothetical protein
VVTHAGKKKNDFLHVFISSMIVQTFLR